MSNSSEYVIIPYEGASSLRFGKSVGSIITALGEPDFKEYDEYGSLLSYPDINLMFSTDGELEEIGFKVNGAKVSICGVALEDGSRKLKPHISLKRFDPEPKETEGGALVFLGLGVSLTGYHTGNESDQAITCFRKGVWNELC